MKELENGVNRKGIGAGIIASEHMKVVKRIRELRLVAVADID
ncbi:hypothetical protein ACTWP4_07420 [Gracilibacillus sp. D59]